MFIVKETIKKMGDKSPRNKPTISNYITDDKRMDILPLWEEVRADSAMHICNRSCAGLMPIQIPFSYWQVQVAIAMGLKPSWWSL